MKLNAPVFFVIVCSFTFCSCQRGRPGPATTKPGQVPDLYIAILGIAQDAGYPQTGCEMECCKAYWEGGAEKRKVVSLGLVDRNSPAYWLIDATPDLREQLADLKRIRGADTLFSPAGILLTHAHIGHYSGLLQFGREAMGSRNLPVYAMPRMDSFLRNNAPWNQLVKLQNIQLRPLQDGRALQLNPSISVTPVRVPHRDEFSETAGFIIQSPKKKVLYIPDIDKWEKWDRDIRLLINTVDLALLDGTFYQNGELPGRDMREIPHPFVTESLNFFSSLSSEQRSKIVFIHFNHTNPLLKKQSPEKDRVKSEGFGVAEEGWLISM